MEEYHWVYNVFGVLIFVGFLGYVLYRVYKSGKGPIADRLRDTVDKSDKK